MSFKADDQFFDFITMGALAAKAVIEKLNSDGFSFIELERSALSNKIWKTKIKRLRLPDLICSRTGLRVEVRAKNNLHIRMSHSETVSDRRWDSGLAPNDLVAFLCMPATQRPDRPLPPVNLFEVDALKVSEQHCQKSNRKADSKGSEVYLTWPSIVPQRNGVVVSVGEDHMLVDYEASSGSKRARINLGTNTHYLEPGDRFVANQQMIAGAPPRAAVLEGYRSSDYDPIAGLNSKNPATRYSSARTILERTDLHREARAVLQEHRFTGDIRASLEIALTATCLGIDHARDFIRSIIFEGKDAALQMEAVFAVAEIGRRMQERFVREILVDVANDRRFANNELRKAAVWGLGRSGMSAYHDLIPFLADGVQDVVLHAIASFASDTPRRTVAELVALLVSAEADRAWVYAACLESIGSERVAECLLRQLSNSAHREDWLLKALSRLPEHIWKEALVGTEWFETVSEFAGLPARGCLEDRTLADNLVRLRKSF